MTDPVSDFFIRIKNAYSSGHHMVEIPYSEMKFALADVLRRHGYIGKIEHKNEKSKKTLLIDLLYPDKQAKFTNLEIVSKPGCRVYIPFKKIPKVLGGLGIAILSTSKGIMSGNEARKKKIGGELICKIW
ncbi:30S ribosomal protein S8 [Candidatus Gottesmanbacteria bacterium RBG_16_37_8]|uniref:Small ribosomal subunit protein uS8 n=1 Tax=Candidatus Gottesmanbacteria bacterium RBG_16_37_8 TaxID=1798371 RepID=A0A1F5YV64_9BACT|nr:MAG: 30S ribosomal protein S8 [Candidatus Gottesmanbacteria bacterium RBG_16_37_8]